MREIFVRVQGRHTLQKKRPQGRLRYSSLQILLYPLHRLNHILAMAKGRKPKVPFPARAEATAGGTDHVAFGYGFVEKRKDHVSARRNSIKMHTKSQLTIPFKPPA